VPLPGSSRRLLVGYGCLVGVPLILLLGVTALGERLSRSDAVNSLQVTAVRPASAAAWMPESSRAILQIAVILMVAHLFGALFRRLGQPRVIGEMVAGILLGPSVAGWLYPAFFSNLFPPASLAHLNILSNLGLVLFMFLVGLSLNAKALQNYGHAAVLTSHVSIALPFVLGAALALHIYRDFSGPGVSFTAFALFMGSAMSITAFPVLARILTERSLLRTRVGTLAIACAAVDDVSGWCILAYIAAVVRASHTALPVWLTLSGLVTFVCVMLLFVKPLLHRVERLLLRGGMAGEQSLVLLLLLILWSSLITDILGIHLLFGSFLVGVITPKGDRVVQYLHERLEATTLLVLLPIFFTLTGLRTNIGLMSSGKMWAVFGLILTVAICGKLGGSAMAARLAGLSWRDATAIGTLLNTRGLMELVILNIGLDLGVLTPALFTMMVFMAIVTTFMTSPLLQWLHPPSLGRIGPVLSEEEQAV
jgi:Kef-type K+ transport system membrane component KefB